MLFLTRTNEVSKVVNESIYTALIDFSLTVKAATFISGLDSARSEIRFS